MNILEILKEFGITIKHEKELEDKSLRLMIRSQIDYFKQLEKDNQSLIKDNQRLQRKVKEPISVDRIEGLESKISGVAAAAALTHGLVSVKSGVGIDAPSIEDHEALKKRVEEQVIRINECFYDMNRFEFLVDGKTSRHHGIKGIAQEALDRNKLLEDRVAELEKRPFIDKDGALNIFEGEPFDKEAYDILMNGVMKTDPVQTR